MALATTLGRDPLADVVIDTGLNWRLVLFVGQPIFLLWILRDAKRLVDPLIALRAGNHRRWLALALTHSLGKSVMVMACLLAPSIAVGLGAFPISAWASRPEGVWGTWPSIALACTSSISVTINFALLGALVLIGSLAHDRLGGVTVAALILTMTIVGSSSPFPWPPLNLGFGIQPGAATEQYGSSLLALTIPTFITFLLAWSSNETIEALKRGQRRSIWAVATMATLVATIVGRLSSGPWDNALEGLIGGFVGSGGSFIDYLFVAILSLTPVWLSITHMEGHLARLPSEIIRLGTVPLWLWRTSSASFAIYPVYSVAVWLFALCILHLRFGPIASSDASLAVTLPDASYHMVINGTLQGWCFLLTVGVCRWASGGAWGSLSGLAGLVAAGALLPRTWWFPVTNLGLGQLIDGQSPFFTTAALTTWLIILSLGARALTSLHSTLLLERNLET